MDPSHNAWASSTEQSQTLPDLQAVLAANYHAKTPTPSAPANKYEAIIEKLTREIESLKSNTNKGTSTSCSQPAKGKKAASTSKAKTTQTRGQRATSAPPVFLSKTPTKARKPPQETAVVKPKPSPKRHPEQMQTADFPPRFTPTKTALFVHIKILWGLLKQDSVPKPPELSTLEEFYKRFRRAEQIEDAVKSGSTNYVRQHEIQCFQNVQRGQVKCGNSIIHLGSRFVTYAQGLMSRLGLRVWCPNLNEDSSSLYNSAHRIAALTTFTELASTPAYAYLNIDPEMAQDMSLLIPAYNHFVHYLQLDKYKKELKEKGKVAQEANNKKISKNRERLRDERRDFAILNKFPQRYREILEPITAHSDDEFVEGKGIYKIKTLPYRSKNANRFFRCLDSVMKDAAGQNPLAKMSCRRTRRLPKKPEMSNFKLAPKGLPIDFYSPKWYHKLLPVQQQSIPNRNALAFLPNAKESLLPKAERHPDEKLADSTFTKKYWEVLAEPYGLVGPGSSAEEESASEDGDSDEEGEGIDLTQPSPDASEDEFLEEGDTGSLYSDEEDSDFIASDDEEEEVEGGGSDDEEDDEYDEAQDNIVMKTIPEGEEEW
ncbi:hypothetical protein VP01_2063g8 [Puccinia sorghi]|uniref:Uncharacterized protein n=1 Tax=Puccinia sorghi TaxID=27349 RepID=A0A0L6VCG1_9BASI|nr:hypothetical protein VP01_2063g8 [Puccinia sorghi]